MEKENAHMIYGEAYHEIKYVPHFEKLMELELTTIKLLQEELVGDTTERNAGMIQGIQRLRELRETYLEQYLEEKDGESRTEQPTARTEPTGARGSASIY